MEEERNPIPDYEGKYDMTSSGRIYSHSKKAYRHREGDEYGFKWVHLSKHGKREKCLTAQLWEQVYPELPKSHYKGM
jgi:hypothetical protein